MIPAVTFLCVEVQPTPSDAEVAASGKALAMWLYNYCDRSLGETDDAFADHTEWRSA